MPDQALSRSQVDGRTGRPILDWSVMSAIPDRSRCSGRVPLRLPTSLVPIRIARMATAQSTLPTQVPLITCLTSLFTQGIQVHHNKSRSFHYSR